MSDLRERATRAAEERQQKVWAAMVYDGDELAMIWDRYNEPETASERWKAPKWGIFYWLRHLIIRAAPTCTLWVKDMHLDAYRFRLNRRWIISRQEIASHG